MAELRETGRAFLIQMCGAQVYEGQIHCYGWMPAGFQPEVRAMRKNIAAFIGGSRYQTKE